MFPEPRDPFQTYTSTLHKNKLFLLPLCIDQSEDNIPRDVLASYCFPGVYYILLSSLWASYELDNYVAEQYMH